MDYDLILLTGPEAGRRLRVGAEPVLIGRSPQAAYSFPLENFLSSRHLVAQAGPSGLILADQQSTNGSFLNDVRLLRTVVARPGDVLRMGSLTMGIAVAENRPAAPDSSSLPARPESMPPATAVAPPLSALGQPALEPPPATLMLLKLAALPIFALVDAAVDDKVLPLLAAAPETKLSLYEGQSAIDLAPQAPYLVQFVPGSPLLTELTRRGWGKGLASYFTSRSPVEDLRRHFRRFLFVQIEGGRQLYFRFYDPRVLRDFLPTLEGPERQAFFGPIHEFLLEDENPATVARFALEGTEITARRTPVAPG